MTTIVASVGYPAAGKSVVADWMENNGVPVLSMGDEIRRRFGEDEKEEMRSVHGDTDESTLKGRWATKQREEHGDDIVARWTCEHIEESVDSDVVFIDGLRSKEELGAFEDQFEDVYVIKVLADRQIRLERIRKRGRDGESKFTDEDLQERDNREDSWGVGEVMNMADFSIENNGTLDEFHEKIETTFKKIQN